MKVQAIGHNGKGRGSRIICFFTRSDRSHESTRFIGVPDDLIMWADRMYGKKWRQLGLGPVTKDHEFESIQGKGVHHQPFIPSDNQTWLEFDHTSEQAVIMFKEACSKVGCKYDWTGIGGFITRRNKEDPDKWFCSEYGCRIRRAASIITQNTPDYMIAPKWSLASVIFRVVRHPIY